MFLNYGTGGVLVNIFRPVMHMGQNRNASTGTNLAWADPGEG